MEYPYVIDGAAGRDVVLPAMYEVRQQFDVLPEVDALAALAAEWPRAAEPRCSRSAAANNPLVGSPSCGAACASSPQRELWVQGAH